MKVRDLMRTIENDGWRHVQTKGSHRQYQRPGKPRRVTIPDIQAMTFIQTH